MAYNNSRVNRSGGDEGDVLHFFQTKVKNLIQKNGGDHTYSSFSEEFHEKDIPLPIGDKTQLMLTHPNQTISQFETGFINMEIEFEIEFVEPFEANAFDPDTGKDNQIFIGFKDAVEIISEAKFYCDGKLINEYYQNELIRENYAYNCIRSRESKLLAPHSHSLWENVIEMSPNVCGTYFPLSSLAFESGHDRPRITITLELIIPFTDQLALQAWRLYPNSVVGEIVEEIKTSLDALVWCQIPPKKVGELMKKRD